MAHGPLMDINLLFNDDFVVVFDDGIVLIFNDGLFYDVRRRREDKESIFPVASRGGAGG